MFVIFERELTGGTFIKIRISIATINSLMQEDHQKEVKINQNKNEHYI